MGALLNLALGNEPCSRTSILDGIAPDLFVHGCLKICVLKAHDSQLLITRQDQLDPDLSYIFVSGGITSSFAFLSAWNP